jgi:hypothetical protein
MGKSRTRPHPCEIWPALGRSRNRLSVQERRYESENRK